MRLPIPISVSEYRDLKLAPRLRHARATKG